MHPVSRQRIEENGQRGDQRLAFPRRHFGDLSLMQNNAAEQLHIVMHHVPRYLISAGRPPVAVNSLVAVDAHKVMLGCQIPVEIVRRDHRLLILLETAGSLFHNGIYFGEHLVQYLFQFLGDLLFNLVHLCPDGFAFFQLLAVDALAQAFHFIPFAGCIILDTFLNLIRPGTQRIIIESLYQRIRGLYLLYVRGDFPQIPLRLIAEQLGHKLIKSHDTLIINFGKGRRKTTWQSSNVQKERSVC
ncbi:hypothetical protein Barb7_03100 [Bacteroidales bacterium Barb7]|nr:hypothetical protein Barb7_03100 [Bacteroidales bacterium Barb7]